jgi:hypothetical protein
MGRIGCSKVAGLLIAFGLLMSACGKDSTTTSSSPVVDPERSDAIPGQACEQMGLTEFGSGHEGYEFPAEAAESVLPSAGEGLEGDGTDYVVILEDEIVARVHVASLPDDGGFYVDSLETCDEWIAGYHSSPDYPTVGGPGGAVAHTAGEYRSISTTWQDADGNELSFSVAGSRSGIAHCGWQSATFLLLGWPLGTHSSGFHDGRQYVRDPDGVVPDYLADDHVAYPVAATETDTTEPPPGFAVGVELPADAVDTGYHTETMRLFISAADAEQAVYMETEDGFERWQRTDATCD